MIRLHRLACLTSLVAIAGCASGLAVTTFDGTYGGALRAQLGASPESCPRLDDPGHATMVIRDGRATVQAIRAAYFSGQVAPDGTLTMISGQGRFAVITGRIVGGTYTAHGTGLCQYSVRLARTSP